MDKQALTAQRAALIAELATPISMQRRAEIQRQLSAVNARIKALNIEEAARNRTAALARQAAGNEQHVADLARAAANVAEVVTVVQKHPAGHERRITLTRGEFVLVAAKKLHRELVKIAPAARATHTIEILPVLERFISGQKELVKSEAKAAAARVSSDPSTWKETWKESD